MPVEQAKAKADRAAAFARTARAEATEAADIETAAATAKNEAVALALVAAAGGGNTPIDQAAKEAVEAVAATAKMASAVAEAKSAQAVKAAEAAADAMTAALAAAETAEAEASSAADDVRKAEEAAARQKRRLAEFIWERLNIRISETAQKAPLPELVADLTSDGGRDGVSEGVGESKAVPVEQVLKFILHESLELQSLYARTDQNTENYAPDGPDLVCYRLLALASLLPDSLQGSADRNYLGRFVGRRERLVKSKRWLTDHLSRILETTNLGEVCDWSEIDRLKSTDGLKGLTSAEKSRLEFLEPLVEEARFFFDRHKPADTETSIENAVATATQQLSPAERRELAMLNRAILDAAFPGTLREPTTVFASNVLAFDQARRWTTFKWCFGLFVFAALMININATTLHGFYARELANNWIQADQDSDLPLSAVDATDQCLPYHILSGSVHWLGKRKKATGDLQRDHFLLSPMYCGCEKTGFVSTARYRNNELGLGDAIAISGAAVSPIQQGNPLLQAMLWLANLRLGQWLPNPNHGTFLPRRSRNLMASIPVTPWRIMMRFFQTAERRPFLFVTDGGHHENLGIGPLLKRRCRFILAVDAGEDAEYAFSDLSRLMRWARVKHNVKLQPVDSLIDTDNALDAAAKAKTPGENAHVMDRLRSAIDAWNDLAPDNGHRLAADRLSSRHFVVLRVHYPDVDGASWLIYAKTSLTGDEPAELIRYAESDKQFPHNPTSNQFYAPDTFEAYRQLGEHMVEAMIGQLPSIIAGKLDEHRGRPEAPYLGGLLHQINIASQTLPLNLSAAPPTPEAVDLLRQLRQGDGRAVVQDQLARRLTVHPVFVARLLRAALRSGKPLKPRLMSFLFPELGPESSLPRQVFSQRRLPGRAQAMRTFKPEAGLTPDEALVESFLQLAESLAVIPPECSESQRERHAEEYEAVYQLLIRIRRYVKGLAQRERIDLLEPTATSSPVRPKRKTPRRKKPPQAPPSDTPFTE